MILPRSSIDLLRQLNGASGGTEHRLRRRTPLRANQRGQLDGCAQGSQPRRCSLRATCGRPQGCLANSQFAGCSVVVAVSHGEPPQRASVLHTRGALQNRRFAAPSWQVRTTFEAPSRPLAQSSGHLRGTFEAVGPKFGTRSKHLPYDVRVRRSLGLRRGRRHRQPKVPCCLRNARGTGRSNGKTAVRARYGLGMHSSCDREAPYVVGGKYGG